MENSERQALGRSLVHAHARRVHPSDEPQLGSSEPWTDALVTLWISSAELRLDFMSMVAGAQEEVKRRGTTAPPPPKLSFPEGVRTETPDGGPTEADSEAANEAAAVNNQRRLAEAEAKMAAAEAAKAAAPPQPADRLSGLVDADGAPLRAEPQPLKQPMAQLLEPLKVVEDEEEDEGLYPSI